MRLRGVPRTAVAYASCLRAMRGADLSDVAALAGLMVRDRIRPDEQLLEAHLEAVLGASLESLVDEQSTGAVARDRLNAAAGVLLAAREQRVLLKASVRRLEDLLRSLGIVGLPKAGGQGLRTGARPSAREAG